MRHKVDGRKFDRNSGARKALFRNLVTQFFMHDRIVTTEARAKEIRRIAEKLITKAKGENVHARRQVLKVIPDKEAVKRLFDIILAKVSDRNTGGYTRIIKIGPRKGDDAPMALLEILEPGSGQKKAKKGPKKKAAGKAKTKEKKGKAKTKAAAPKETISKDLKPESSAEETTHDAVKPSEISSDTTIEEEASPEAESEASLPAEKEPEVEATDEETQPSEGEKEGEEEKS
jgi:large subunit ribosomal protein L17